MGVYSLHPPFARGDGGSCGVAMFRCISGRLLGLALVSVLLVLGLVKSGLGQGKQLGSKVDLQAEYDKVKQQLQKLFSGERPPQGKEDDKLMEALARYFLYRVT